MTNPIYAKLQEMAEENLTADKVFELFEAEQIAVELQIKPDLILRYVATTCDKTFWGDTAWSALWQAWAHYYEFVKEHEAKGYTVMRHVDSPPYWIPYSGNDETLESAERLAMRASALKNGLLLRIKSPHDVLLAPTYSSGLKDKHS